jgi:hypothetical protein
MPVYIGRFGHLSSAIVPHGHATTIEEGPTKSALLMYSYKNRLDPMISCGQYCSSQMGQYNVRWTRRYTLASTSKFSTRHGRFITDRHADSTPTIMQRIGALFLHVADAPHLAALCVTLGTNECYTTNGGNNTGLHARCWGNDSQLPLFFLFIHQRVQRRGLDTGLLYP